MVADTDWHGTHLTEDDIVLDMLAKIRGQGDEAVKRWNDPRSWSMPILADGRVDPEAPDYAGCLMFCGMSIRNYYGLWRDDCPITKAGGDDLEISDGVITDARHPDNVSGRILDRVRAALAEPSPVEAFKAMAAQATGPRNAIKASIRPDRKSVDIIMHVDGADGSWVNFNAEQLAEIIRLLESVRAELL